MNNIEECQNTIELLKQALKFYANENNYLKGKLPEGEFDFDVCIRPELRIPRPSLVDMDNGTQARFALEKLEQQENLNKEMEDEYTKDVTDKDVLNAIEEFKKTAENFGNKL
jgi:hypothetical protein